ncbi:MAG: aminoglycoside phosphotransferase family protein [Nocardioidaceae bacterium]
MLTSDGIDTTRALGWASRFIGPLKGVQELAGGQTSTMLGLTPETGDRAVLRLMTREPWRTHGAGLTSRESDIQQMLAETPVAAPRSLALDAFGEACGHPAHLMSFLPGQIELGRSDAVSLQRLAELLTAIHAVRPTVAVRTYQSWAWEAKYTVPSWASDRLLWEDAFALLRTEPPPYEPCFIHRDFAPRNVLWCAGRVSGVVDWVETSLGPAWLDVAHCCTNISISNGDDFAQVFAAAYVERTGRVPQPYFDVMDIVGFLPPPGVQGFITDPREQARLEARLAWVVRTLERPVR